jgi:hypothetical protein
LAHDLRADTFSISVRFARGIIGELLVAASAFRPNDFSLEMWLSQGSIVGTKIFRRTGDAVAGAAEEIKVEQRIIDLGLQFTDLVNAIESGAEPLNSFSEARRNLLVIQAVEESLRTGALVKVRGASGAQA